MKLLGTKLNKSYNGRHILKDCSFSFERPGMYLLMGPNGSGKSTLLRVCALLEKPDNGEVQYSSGTGNMPQDIRLKRQISLVLPKIGIFNTTVFCNVAYGLKVRNVNKKEVEDRVESALKFVGLTHKRDMNALALSSGETQRLGIARAVVLKPEILFLDEPTASLDPYNTKVIEEMIISLREQGIMTILMVTHNIFQAQRLADTVLFMYEGTIIDQGNARQFFEKPGDERAHKFITGQMVY
ncbi:MAG: phosphate ABC transporter ATP-binding protein [Thermodesulfovibrionales bacterium]|nr:phosphate ABC transporter ATP-binding protein [Thermodesulfovibrionales bacterium]